MLEANPDIVLIKDPVPVPSIVWLSVIVGLGVKLQHIPLSKTMAPPSEVTFPPLVAVVWVISVTAVVVIVGVVCAYTPNEEDMIRIIPTVGANKFIPDIIPERLLISDFILSPT